MNDKSIDLVGCMAPGNKRGIQMVSEEEIKTIIGDVLKIEDRLPELSIDSPLLGAIPEFDSMAVVSILTAIEDSYGIIIEDDEISAEIFETLGDLVRFVGSKTI